MNNQPKYGSGTNRHLNSSLMATSQVLPLLIFAFLFAVCSSSAQSIPGTDGSVSRCGNCVPPGWVDLIGSPDVSDRDTVAGPGAGAGEGEAWTNAPLPLPPNNHTSWITLRDVGMLGGEEAIGTTITGLTVGRSYEIFVYSMSALAPVYGPKYIDFFQFQVEGLAEVNIDSVSQEVWGVSKLRFPALAATRNFNFTPGQNMVGSFENLEAVNLSISTNAINAVPIAGNDTSSTTSNVSVDINIVNNDSDSDGNIVALTVDLDTALAGIQTSVTTTGGIWSVDALGLVTFIPANGFVGIATLPYTVQDDYVLDGISAPSTSQPATIIVVVNPPIDTIIIPPGDTCLPMSVLQLTNIESASICGMDPDIDLMLDPTGSCLTANLVDTLHGGQDTVCVVHCTTIQGFEICDTSIIIIQTCPQLSITYSNTDTICSDDTTMILLNGLAGSTVIHWSNSIGQRGTIVNGEIPVTFKNWTAQPYTISYEIIADNDFCSDTIEAEIVVLPVPQLNVLPGIVIICQPGDVSIKAISTLNGTITWTGPNNSNGMATTMVNIVDTLAIPANYVYTFISESNGCSSETIQVDVTVE